jgi:hypothetical protein
MTKSRRYQSGEEFHEVKRSHKFLRSKRRKPRHRLSVQTGAMAGHSTEIADGFCRLPPPATLSGLSHGNHGASSVSTPGWPTGTRREPMKKVLHVYHVPTRIQTAVALIGIFQNPCMFGAGGSIVY